MTGSRGGRPRALWPAAAWVPVPGRPEWRGNAGHGLWPQSKGHGPGERDTAPWALPGPDRPASAAGPAHAQVPGRHPRAPQGAHRAGLAPGRPRAQSAVQGRAVFAPSAHAAATPRVPVPCWRRMLTRAERPPGACTGGRDPSHTFVQNGMDVWKNRQLRRQSTGRGLGVQRRRGWNTRLRREDSPLPQGRSEASWGGAASGGHGRTAVPTPPAAEAARRAGTVTRGRNPHPGVDNPHRVHRETGPHISAFTDPSLTSTAPPVMSADDQTSYQRNHRKCHSA